MADSTRSLADEVHMANLDRSLRELQTKVHEHEQELEKLRANATSPTPKFASPTAPVEIMKVAFDDLTQEDAFLPFPSSVLPALLALRKTHQTIVESRAYLATQGSTLAQARRDLETEKANLADQQLLTQGLERRLGDLTLELEDRMDVTGEQVAQERILALSRKKKAYDNDTSRLMRSLNAFIDAHLAPMLAAEDLGGPVVGDMMDIEEENLVAGFNARGAPKKAKAQPPDEDKRQRRIDDIWGSREPVADGGRASSSRRRSRGEKDPATDEAAAAGQEMRRLTEALLNQLIEASGDSSAAYVTLAKESAAARFLVRSKVAQFHPRDATRLRLVDFGRELDD